MYIYIQLTIHKCLFSHTYTLNVAVKIVLKRQQHMFPLEKFYRGEIFTKTFDQPNQQKKEIPIHIGCVCVVTQRRRLLVMSVIKEKYEKIMIFYLNVKMTKQYVHSSPHSLCCFFFG